MCPNCTVSPPTVWLGVAADCPRGLLRNLPFLIPTKSLCLNTHRWDASIILLCLLGWGGGGTMGVFVEGGGGVLTVLSVTGEKLYTLCVYQPATFPAGGFPWRFEMEPTSPNSDMAVSPLSAESALFCEWADWDSCRESTDEKPESNVSLLGIVTCKLMVIRLMQYKLLSVPRISNVITVDELTNQQLFYH